MSFRMERLARQKCRAGRGGVVCTVTGYACGWESVRRCIGPVGGVGFVDYCKGNFNMFSSV
jgi:hypothetical protein